MGNGWEDGGGEGIGAKKRLNRARGSEKFWNIKKKTAKNLPTKLGGGTPKKLKRGKENHLQGGKRHGRGLGKGLETTQTPKQ